jgi:hypothetical protein
MASQAVPVVPGSNYAGTVEAIGADVEGLSGGRRGDLAAYQINSELMAFAKPHASHIPTEQPRLRYSRPWERSTR